MEPTEPLRLTIEVDRADPLEGRVGRAGEGLRPFVSWLGLASKLDELLASDSAGGPNGGDQEVREPEE